MNYLWQITETRPNGWNKIAAASPEAAAIAVAQQFCCHGRQVVNIAVDDPKNLHPNGAPFKNHRFELDVDRSKAA